MPDNDKLFQAPMKPETGAQSWDAKSARDSESSRARLGEPQDAERAARPSDSPLAKFARVWSR